MANLLISKTQSVTLSEAKTVRLTSLQTVLDGVTLAENVGISVSAQSGALSINKSDPVSLSEGLFTQIPISIQTANSVVTSEGILSSNEQIIVLQQGLFLSEAVSTSVDIGVGVADTSTVSEPVGLGLPLSLLVVDNGIVSETMALDGSITSLAYSGYESVTISELVSPNITLSLSASEGILTSETLRQAPGIGIVLSDTVAVLDLMSASGIGNAISVTDVVSVSDLAGVGVRLDIVTADAVSYSESLGKFALASARLADSITVSDNAVARLQSYRSIAETVSLSDITWVQLATVLLSISVSDGVNTFEDSSPFEVANSLSVSVSSSVMTNDTTSMVFLNLYPVENSVKFYNGHITKIIGNSKLCLIDTNLQLAVGSNYFLV